MNIRELLVNNLNPILDPAVINMTPAQFIAEYGGNLSKIGLVVKPPSGRVYYDSATAPKNPVYGNFLKEFTKISSDIFEVYAVVNTLIDSYTAEDPKYSSFKSGGGNSSTHICPSEKTVNYLAKILEEIAKYPVKGIILVGNTFINRNYCFCDNCKSEFSQIAGIPPSFDFNRIQVDSDLQSKWVMWRADKLSNMVAALAKRVKEVNEKIEVYSEIYLEPAVNYTENLELEYGQNIETLSRVAKIMFNVHPWTPILPEVNSVEYSKLIKSITSVESLKRSGVKPALLYWNVANEDELDIIKSISGKVSSGEVYTYNSYPLGYNQLRELHLGR
ncbi:MAG: hypothetical protein OdinLCB4_005620 [Candidatus Odinarchaeum yellowstonii]|uniref:Uncharacterized protein n=1 Tax=Odinarchaeota yellowstonii (strain LCB_4) TaxID=1841599 RepID=A0AAF0D1J7_ODILC|nr:MAG: hypothetical protein OdinLCB4_005620 [Candidatus Odinarchaeum yellowstonii]